MGATHPVIIGKFTNCSPIFAYSHQIDFGEGEINFGDDLDFGDIGVENADDGAEIDWGEQENSIQEIDVDDSGITVESSGIAGGVAKDENAFTVLDSPSYREQFLDELFEVI